MSTQAKRLGGGAIATAMVGILVAAMMAFIAGGPQATAAAQRAGDNPVLSSDFGKAKSHVHGTFGRNGTVTGTFTPRRFVSNDAGDKLFAVGKLKATAIRGDGHVIGTETKRGVRMPVRAAEGAALRGGAASCEILNLVLGPLHIDLLGLEIDLNRVVLNIVATPGPGNLLGNLLCAVAGLLDGGLSGILDEIADILNSILALLRL